jgi:hypothetical protein
MPATLIKHGDDYLLVVDQAVLDHLGIGPDTPLDYTVRDGALIVTPIEHASDATDPGAEQDA